MTKEFSQQLKTFSEDSTRLETEQFLEAYWLGPSELSSKWENVFALIFDKDGRYLPDMMFNLGYELFPLFGGDIFVSESDFKLFKKCMMTAGDRQFAIVQNEQVVIETYVDGETKVLPPLKLCFPADVSWDELFSGGLLSQELFRGSPNDYFVFGDSGRWGRYVANDYTNARSGLVYSPLVITGYRPEVRECFSEGLSQLRLEEESISIEDLFSKILPENYLPYCK